MKHPQSDGHRAVHCPNLGPIFIKVTQVDKDCYGHNYPVRIPTHWIQFKTADGGFSVPLETWDQITRYIDTKLKRVEEQTDGK